MSKIKDFLKEKWDRATREEGFLVKFKFKFGGTKYREEKIEPIAYSHNLMNLRSKSKRHIYDDRGSFFS